MKVNRFLGGGGPGAVLESYEKPNALQAADHKYI